eukprot:TRINITY_DN13092_c0_g1_i1.p1 TRINITY_DN13092_c0_g1~~TRINITY_DN13092_c0_g1_i1.p1  ORF type:complete len:159 (-),score=12.28 TRINITY_DN13092_c0_g1_i1:285-761(-)
MDSLQLREQVDDIGFALDESQSPEDIAPALKRASEILRRESLSPNTETLLRELFDALFVAVVRHFSAALVEPVLQLAISFCEPRSPLDTSVPLAAFLHRVHALLDAAPLIPPGCEVLPATATSVLSRLEHLLGPPPIAPPLPLTTVPCIRCDKIVAVG